MNPPSCSSNVALCWLALSVVVAACSKDCACGSGQPEVAATPAPVVVAPAPAPEAKPEAEPKPGSEDPQKPVLPEDIPPIPTVPSEHPVGYPKAGWSKVVVDDQGPLCLFPDLATHFRYKFFKDVDKQTLKANTAIVVGSFGPYCINETCDDLPTLQCEATLDPDGRTIVVKTHYWAYHKDGSSCVGQLCRPVFAGCETPVLPPGKYTIKHGAKSYPLKLPATLANPCFGSEIAPPPAAQ